MTRILKFRAWDKKNKEMFCDTKFSMQSIADERYAGYGEDLEIMQFTGLLDKNGKEIYEGDIIKLSSGYVTSVVYDKDSFIVKSLGFPISEYSLEVIGNIYENPDLIK